MGEPVSRDGNCVKNVVSKLLRDPEFAAAQPVMMERHHSERAANQPESVDIGLARRPPSVKGDSELVGASGRGKEFGFVDSKRLIEQANRRDRCFADAHDSDLIGLDQGHRHSRKAEASKRCSGHPPRRAASDDDDPTLAYVTHR